MKDHDRLHPQSAFIESKHDLEKYLNLTETELKALELIAQPDSDRLPLRVSSYYASLADPDNPRCPVRRIFVPDGLEWCSSPGEQEDPLQEEQNVVAPGLIRRYRDRVLMLVTDQCATYCRFCTRGRWTGRRRGTISSQELGEAVSWLAANPEVEEVLLSGGDPLMLSDSRLDWLLEAVKSVGSVKRIRIGTRIPVTLPSRITLDLVGILKKYSPVFVLTHFNHPAEITAQSAQACSLFVDGGVPVENQTVLLKGINDSAQVLGSLFTGLLNMRVRPYYLHHCDPAPGTHAFRTSISTGVSIMESLRRDISGLAVPSYVIDLPGSGGKVPLLPGYLTRDGCGQQVSMRGNDGKNYRVVD